MLFYSPDFSAPDSDPYYGLAEGYPACYFELRVTDLLKAGANSLRVANQAAADYVLVAGEGGLIHRVVTLDSGAVEPHARPLPRFVPETDPRQEFSVSEPDSATIAVSVGKTEFTVTSRFSTPAGAWERKSNEFFRHERSVTREREAVVVRDTFTNLTNDPLPLIRREEAALGDTLDRVWLGGLLQPDKAGRTTTPMNPTLCATTGSAGFGIVPLDDVFRIHGQAFAEQGTVGMCDDQLVLAPGKACTAEWAIVPFSEGDYWTFLNATRRLMKVNFTIDGGFAFLRNGPLTDAWPDQQVSDFLRFKDPKYVCAGIAHPMYNGTYTHGTSFQRIALDSYNTSFARWRKLAPERKYLVYFHCFIDVVEDGPQLFADARHLNANGQQADYGDPVDKLYVPLVNNSFGPAVAKNVDLILDQIGANGVYWDEQEYSRYLYTYGEPWDGCSGDIDPVTMKLQRLKASTTLLTESWRLELARKILSRGSLVANSPCLTKARMALHFPCFVETGSISNCTQAHLYTPIALGDHLTERSEEDAYGVMLAALDFGCVYHWYNDMTVTPTHATLTSWMFPITPMELHEGCIIGEERIITNRSGIYGWNDDSRHEVRVFDAKGVETREVDFTSTQTEGKTTTELRIPAGWSAAILRR